MSFLRLRNTALAGAALAAIVFTLYAPALRFSFQLYDDNVYVTYNPFVQAGLEPASIAWAFRDDGPYRRMWHPLTMISHMLDVQLWGMQPGFHHLTNVVLHVLNACLLFFFLKRETGKSERAWFVAALFALHPINVEPVAWIAQRKTLLSACFWLLTLLAYGSYLRRPSRLRYGVALGWYVLGWLSKPTMAVLPIVLMLLDYWPWRRWTPGKSTGEILRERGMEKWPFFVLAMVLGAWACIVQQRVGTLEGGLLFSWSSRLTHALVAFAFSSVKTLWPTGLTFFYPMTGLTLPLSQWGTSLLMLATVSGVALLLRRSAPYFFVGWGWFIVTFLPASGLLMQIGLYFHEDHFMYVPIIGLLICLVWSVAEFAALNRVSNRVALASTVVVLVIVGLTARRQLNYWRDSVSLLRREWEVMGTPSLNPRARGNLSGLYAFHADAWYREGRLVEAVEGYDQALRLQPDNVVVALRQAGLQFRLGQVERAQETVEAALQQNPGEARLLQIQAYLRAQRGS